MADKAKTDHRHSLSRRDICLMDALQSDAPESAHGILTAVIDTLRQFGDQVAVHAVDLRVIGLTRHGHTVADFNIGHASSAGRYRSHSRVAHGHRLGQTGKGGVQSCKEAVGGYLFNDLPRLVRTCQHLLHEVLAAKRGEPALRTGANDGVFRLHDHIVVLCDWRRRINYFYGTVVDHHKQLLHMLSPHSQPIGVRQSAYPSGVENDFVAQHLHLFTDLAVSDEDDHHIDIP